MEWPPDSPDLNPTEWMWRGSKAKIKRYPRLITNEKDMFEAASREWLELVGKGKPEKWMASMKDRCRAVIKNRGFSTKY